LADALYSSEQELLSRKVLQVLIKHSGSAALVLKKWRARTSCRTGYVVEQCKEYKAPKTPTTTPSVAIQIEEIAGLARAAHPEVNPVGADDQLCRNAPSGKGYLCVTVPKKKPSAGSSGASSGKP
jgi:hypothetical protein